MTDVSYPRAETNWSLPEWRTYHRLDSGIIGSVGGTDRQVYVDGSGPYFKRFPGARYIQGVYGADDTTWISPTVAPNISGQPRIDRVVDQLNEDGTMETVVVPGTPSTTPAPPALTQTPGGIWQEHLAYGTVKAGFTNLTAGDAQVVDERRFMPVRVYPVAAEALRPAASVVNDEAVYPDGRRERWNGTSWVPVVFTGVALFSDPGFYAAMASFSPPGITASPLGTITLPFPTRLLVTGTTSTGFDNAGVLLTLGVGARLTPVGPGTAQGDYVGTGNVVSTESGNGGYLVTETLTPELAAGTYQVRAFVKNFASTPAGAGVAFHNPRIKLTVVQGLA